MAKPFSDLLDKMTAESQKRMTAKIRDFIRTFTGPWPYFYVEKDIRSNLHDKPEIRYYLWVSRCFGDATLVGSTANPEDLPAKQKEWEEFLKDYDGSPRKND